jgi:hypothetical protein
VAPKCRCDGIGIGNRVSVPIRSCVGGVAGALTPVRLGGRSKDFPLLHGHESAVFKL